MQVINRVDGITPVEKITLELTGAEYETVLRGLRRLQVSSGAFQRAKATQTRGYKWRAERLHQGLTGRVR